MKRLKRETIHLLFNIEKAFACIANDTDDKHTKLQKWAEQKYKEVFDIRTTFCDEATIADYIYKKVEIEIENADDENTKNFEVVLDEKANFYRRIDSISLVKNRDLLIELYKKISNVLLKKEIIKVAKLEEIYDLALRERNETLKIEVIKAIDEKIKLEYEARHNESSKVRIAALKKVTDQHKLQKIVLTDKNDEVKKAAVQQIKSISLLNATKPHLSADMQNYIDKHLLILTLNGTDDYLKKSIESIINY